MPEYTLDEWRAVMCGRVVQPSNEYIVIAFPDDAVAQAYLRRASSWPEDEVRKILRAMVGSSRSVPSLDQLNVARLSHLESATSPDADSAITRPRFSEYDRRAILSVAGESKEPTLEGLTWILDLLPHSPQYSLNTINAYVAAHREILSDLRISGLEDARSLIRNRYILQGRSDLSTKVGVLLSLEWREFEYLVAELYAAQGYDVEVTPPQKDRGKDVIARGPNNEVVLVECKNWKGKVDAQVVAALAGRVEIERATRGVIVASSGFTAGPASATEVATQAATRISLIGGDELVQTLNTHLGADWPVRVDRLIQAQRRSQESRR